MAAADTARRLAATALNCDPESLPPDAAIGSVPEWDSIGHVTLILAVEAHLGRTLTAEEIASIVSLASIETLLAG